MAQIIKIKDLVLGAGCPAICVPLTAKKRTELLVQAREALEAGADLVEWRADWYEEENFCDMTAAITQTLENRIPLLFTFRTAKEGGRRQLDPENYARLILAVAKCGHVQLTDVEVLSEPDEKQELVKELKNLGIIVVASNHDFEKTDSLPMLVSRFCTLSLSGAQILKLAVMPKNSEDPRILMEAVRQTREILPEKLIIAMAMGEMGKRTRYLGERFGSCLTFGTVGQASAPGQLPVPLLREALLRVHQEIQAGK